MQRAAALLMDFLNTPEKRDRRLVHLPMGRFGEAIEIAKAVLFCACTFLFAHLPFVRWNLMLLHSGDGREQLRDGAYRQLMFVPCCDGCLPYAVVGRVPT
jgi:hypothetical protein